MENLPTGAVLGVIALALIWTSVCTAVHSARPRDPARYPELPTPAWSNNGLLLLRCACQVLLLTLGLTLGVSHWGIHGLWAAGGICGSLLLVFGEYLPRLIARRHPEALVWLGNSLLAGPLKLIWPFTCLFHGIARGLLWPFGRHERQAQRVGEGDPEQDDELIEEDDATPDRPALLDGIRALENITVNDILVPRHEVDGVNLDEPLDKVREQLIISRHTRLPVFHGDINQVEAVLNTRQISHLLARGDLTLEALKSACYEPYFVPESTPLPLQLLNFHKQQRRLGVVVDEYGDVQGIVTLEDILEEIVGEFEDEHTLDNPHVHPQPDGRYVLDGAASIRELNKALGWHMPIDGPKTLNGLLTEALESIPDCPVCLKIGRYRLEILETEDNRIAKVMAWQPGPARVR